MSFASEGNWGNTRCVFFHALWLVLGALWCTHAVSCLKRQGLTQESFFKARVAHL